MGAFCMKADVSPLVKGAADVQPNVKKVREELLQACADGRVVSALNEEAGGSPSSTRSRSPRTLQDFTEDMYISAGSFCTVVRCIEKKTGEAFAMKQVPKKRGGIDQGIAMEAHCLGRLLGSPRVVSLLHAFDTPCMWYGILELCPAGELWSYVRHCGCCLEGEAEWYASQMVEALHVVHTAQIVHRDVKCENFLVADGRLLKLIDFGTARDLAHPEVGTMKIGPAYEHHVGTPNFMAPEVVHGKANDRRSDLWSLGCSVCQLLPGR
eukprot:TRINITY_DN19696_c0_g1_i2.p1 TRINITY_DN19696_c0_g1~~TRINITY_DN19696_c0_g1_i2.p1  ORF type:complete len:267 (-),score=62.42 TRINITY_DN19696_c0_g1_i2:479-1279(-)